MTIINDSKTSMAITINICFLLSPYVHCGPAAVLTHIFFAIGPTLTDKPLSEILMFVMREGKECGQAHADSSVFCQEVIYVISVHSSSKVILKEGIPHFMNNNKKSITAHLSY